MEAYTPIFTITPEILNSAYEIAADLERKLKMPLLHTMNCWNVIPTKKKTY